MPSGAGLRHPRPAAPPSRPQRRVVSEVVETWGEKTAVSQTPSGSPQNWVEKMCIHMCMRTGVYETCPGEYRRGNI